MIGRLHVATFLALCGPAVCLSQPHAIADSDEAATVLPVSTVNIASALNEGRIFGIIPDFQTVTDTGLGVKPLTARQKWSLALKETVDPFNLVNAAMGAAFSQRGNQTPKYGKGGRAYGQRFGAAFADSGTQNFFSSGLLATVLHQDPRYYRKGPGTGIAKRVVYSASALSKTYPAVLSKSDPGILN